MEKNFHFGLVGCGNIGKRHAEIIKKIGTLASVCDINKRKAIEFSEKYKTKYFTTYSDFLDYSNNIDIIVICTPNYLHADQAIQAMAKGYHTLCEKPMALNVRDCNRMFKAATENQKVLLIVKQNRFNPPVAYLKGLLDSKKLGNIYSISMNCLWNRNQTYYSVSNWRGKKDLDGGILFTQFSHFFDVAIWLFGKAFCISAIGNNFAHRSFTDFDDTIMALMKFNCGTLGAMHFSTNAHNCNMEGSLTVIGENGSIAIGGEYLNKLVYHNVNGLSVPNFNYDDKTNDYGNYKGSMNNHESVYKDFIHSISNNEISYSELTTSVLTINAIESVYKALGGK